MMCILREIQAHIVDGVLQKDSFKMVYVAPMKVRAQAQAAPRVMLRVVCASTFFRLSFTRCVLCAVCCCCVASRLWRRRCKPLSRSAWGRWASSSRN